MEFLVQARMAPDVAEVTEAVDYFGKIQWMPPGRNVIHATVNGAPKQVKVNATPAAAQLVDSRLKEMMAKAERGEGPLPFCDFDHKGESASCWPFGAFWAGDDPSGGIQLHVQWSTEGRAKVKGASFRYFSPEFLVNSDGDLVNITNNLGGLTNSPAFLSISTVQASSPQPQNSALPMNTDFQTQVNAYASRHRIEIADAAAIVSARNPSLYDEDRLRILGTEDRGFRVHVQAASSWEEGNLFVQARAVSERDGCSEIEAALVVASRSPDSYLDYLNAILEKGGCRRDVHHVRACGGSR